MFYYLVSALGALDRSTEILKTLLPGNDFIGNKTARDKQHMDLLRNEGASGLISGSGFGLLDLPRNLNLAATKVSKLVEDLPVVISNVRQIAECIKNINLDDLPNGEHACIYFEQFANKMEQLLSNVDELQLAELQTMFLDAMRIYSKATSFLKTVQDTVMFHPQTVRSNLVLWNALKKERSNIEEYVTKTSHHVWLLHKLLEQGDLVKSKRDLIDDYLQNWMNNNNLFGAKKVDIYNCHANNWSTVLHFLRDDKKVEMFLSQLDDNDVIEIIKKMGNMPALIKQLDDILKDKDIKHNVKYIGEKVDQQLANVVKLQQSKKDKIDANLRNLKDSFALPQQIYQLLMYANVMNLVTIKILRKLLDNAKKPVNLLWNIFSFIMDRFLFFIYAVARYAIYIIYFIVLSCMYIIYAFTNHIMKLIFTILLVFGVTYNVNSFSYLMYGLQAWLRLEKYVGIYSFIEL